MPTQTANPIPTQLNIAPRGKRWKDWQLVDGEIGFPTREAMEKYHCHPERVQALEAERLALLESNRQLNQLNDRQAAQIKELEAQMEAVGAGGVEPLRKQTQLAAVQQEVQPAWFVLRSKDGEAIMHLLPAIAERDRAEHEKYGRTLLPLYTHPTQQGLDRQQIDPLRQMIAQHQAHLEQNQHAYFELAYTRSTGWMVWITDKPLCSPVVNPDRKVLWRGQGDTPDEACENAALAAKGVSDAA